MLLRNLESNKIVRFITLTYEATWIVHNLALVLPRKALCLDPSLEILMSGYIVKMGMIYSAQAARTSTGTVIRIFSS